MKNKSKPRGYWTRERVFAEGKNHPNRRSWQLAQSRSYMIAYENKWLDEILGREITHGNWTKEAVLLSGRKYATKIEWRNSPEGSAYVIAKRNGWLKQLTHFDIELSYGERVIFTWLLARDIEFEKEKVFHDLRDKYPLRFDFWIPSHNLLIEFQGRQHEVGWGGDLADAKEIKRRDALKRNYALRNGIVLLKLLEIKEEAISSILAKYIGAYPKRQLRSEESRRIKNLGGWSKERAMQDAKNFKTRKEWDSASHGYAYARLNGFLNEACAHMSRANAWTTSRKRVWSKEAVVKDARKYDRPGEWKKSSPSAYAISLRNGWHFEATAHMTRNPKLRGY